MEVISLERARDDWQRRCQKNEKGKLLPNYANAVLALRADPAVADLTRRLEADVAAGITTPTAAARAILAAFLAPGHQ